MPRMTRAVSNSIATRVLVHVIDINLLAIRVTYVILLTAFFPRFEENHTVIERAVILPSRWNIVIVGAVCWQWKKEFTIVS